MPELPEVETVRTGLTPYMQDARINRVELRRKNLRFDFPKNLAQRLEGCKISHVGRRAKFLTFTLDSGWVLISHLGMSGSWHIENEPGEDGRYHSSERLTAHDHVVFEVQGEKGAATIYYNDPRRFGYMDLVRSAELDSCKHFSNLGIEPTGNQLNGASINTLFLNKAAPLKAALLDQKLIAGLGNIYVCEALWQAGLSPMRKAASICARTKPSTQRTEVLASQIRDVIDRAIQAGGSTLQDHRQPDGTLGYFQHSFAAYDREGEACKKETCSGVIKRFTQSGRSTYYCPKCQH